MSFEETYDQLASAVYRYLRRLLGSRAQAEDLLQETFLKLHFQLQSGRPLLNTRAWLFRVATNLAKDSIRDEMRLRLRGEVAFERRVVDFHSGLQDQQIIRLVLDRLTPRMRQVLLLSAEGFSYREISEITRIEAAYVGVLLQRARSAFRKNYEQQSQRHNEEQHG